jgi:hypothetical protein
VGDFSIAPKDIYFTLHYINLLFLGPYFVGKIHLPDDSTSSRSMEGDECQKYKVPFQNSVLAVLLY